jgi:Mg/Co/Ni transporter MgtE
MYFLITGTYQDEQDVEGLECGNFEWVVEADNQAAAIAQLEKGETLVSIREISVEERIEREERELLESIEREYIFQIVGDLPIREATKQMREMKANREIYYLALKYFNKRQRLARMLKRQKGVGELSTTEYAEVLNKLIDAQTEEEFNKVLGEINKGVK